MKDQTGASDSEDISRRRALRATAAGFSFTALGVANPALAQGGSGNEPGLPAQPRRSPDLRDWNAVGNGDVRDGPRLQRALDECPLGETLHIPPGDYWVGRPDVAESAGLVISRQINIAAHGGRIVGDFRDDNNSNLINVRVKQATKGAGDVRLMRISGLGAFFASGGQTTIDVENAAPMASNLQMWFEHCSISTRAESNGSALRFGGVLTQLHTVINCLVENQIHLDGCADACRFLYNTVGGSKTGFRVRLALGAFRTLIAHNVIVPRDGAILVESGSQLDFLFNQCEQMAMKNSAQHRAHVVFNVAKREMSRRCNIVGNNFGGGSNLDHAIVLTSSLSDFGLEDILISDNTFGLTATGIDVVIADSNVRDTRVATDNFARGKRMGIPLDATTGRIASNSLDGSEQISITDFGAGSYGIWKQLGLDLANGWTSDTSDPCRYRKTLDNDLQWNGSLQVGVAEPGTQIGLLPLGFRPHHDLWCSVAGNRGSGTLLIAATGRVTVGNLPTGTALLSMGGVRHRVQGKASYNPGV